MNTEYTRKVLEAALMAAGRTLSLAELAQLFDEVDRPDAAQLRVALAELGDTWNGRAIELKETAMGFRAQVRREFAEQVSRMWPERPPRYSRALLETLSIIAYRQPITRGEIEGVRGVAVNPNIVRTLFERNWIRVVGHREVPGRPELLGTTRDFLDYFGLKTLDQLPPLAEIKSLEELDPQLALPEPVGVALPAPATMGESDDGQAPDEAAAGETQTGDGVEPVGDDAPVGDQPVGGDAPVEDVVSVEDAAPVDSVESVDSVEPVGTEPLEDEPVGLEPVDDTGAVVNAATGPDDSGEEAETEPDEPAREATAG